MSEKNEISSAIDTMNRARNIIEDDMRITSELRAQIEHQRKMICVALGYIESGRPALAAMVLSEKETA